MKNHLEHAPFYICYNNIRNFASENLNADKHSPASSARSTKRWVRGCLCQWEPSAPTDRSRSDCVHEQVAKRIANVRFTCWKKPQDVDNIIVKKKKWSD